MRELIITHKDILMRFEKIKQKIAEHDNNILLIFEYIKQLENEKQHLSILERRKRIGYKQNDD